MIVRERSLATGLDIVANGADFDVVGVRGAGKTTFLSQLCSKLIQDDWKVVSLRGVASLRKHPLAALRLAGLTGAKDPLAASPIDIIADELRRKTQGARSVVVIDDWDDLDEASWGVVDWARREHGFCVVRARLKGLRARHTPSGLTASSLGFPVVVELEPLRIEELEQVISMRLHARIETITMGELYAASGGIVGLASSLADTAAREGRIELIGGEWVAVGEVWSPALRTVVEGHLEDLPAEMRDALEMAALLEGSDAETLRTIVSREALEFLEERALVRLLPSGAGELISVTPPILVDYFRHEPDRARKQRLNERVSASGSPALLDLAHISPPTPAAHSEDRASYSRLILERDRRTRIASESEWRRSPNPTTAARYIRCLLKQNAAESIVSEVMSGTDRSLGDAAGLAEFAVVCAQWRAYSLRDLDGAFAALREAATCVGVYQRALDAASVMIETDLRAVPEDFLARLEITPDLPAEVEAAVKTAQIAVFSALGRFGEARGVLDSMPAPLPNGPRSAPHLLYGINLLGLGDHSGAVSWGTRGVDEALACFDVESARSHGAFTAFAQAISGDYAAAQGILDRMFAGVPRLPFPLLTELTLLSVAASAAVRRGDVALAERHAQELAKLSPSSPYLDQALVWARVHLLSFQGRPDEAANLAWEVSGTLWIRGARFLAVLLSLLALEIVPNTERTTATIERCRQIDDDFVAPHLRFIVARDARDPEQLVEAVPALLSTGRKGIAVVALEIAEEIWIERGDTDHAGTAAARRRALLDRLGREGAYTVRFRATELKLTDRETEIALLVAAGLTNPEIATRLVLSVRTVESHLHRMMRKARVNSRQELSVLVQRRA
ncbi:LuxR C-terminal-related transcriptional regulator [Microbacterium sp.]|uniref:helix-turn-helix transcriptional regulator n=1 Tax=Microbacterium sp. TaxID=51671 RepID=UPI001ACAC3F3|nr:LuxR C-terminal-related transcriptional regulator [Microbacterium sp.]MBN9156555.1 hypothetical protein [Microbacterium sp.]